jgi:hypothetical protein
MKCEGILNKDFIRVCKRNECKKIAKFKIYGKNLCNTHAALKCFKILNQRGEIVVI